MRAAADAEVEDGATERGETEVLAAELEDAISYSESTTYSATEYRSPRIPKTSHEILPISSGDLR